jgi:hypothetical protein
MKRATRFAIGAGVGFGVGSVPGVSGLVPLSGVGDGVGLVPGFSPGLGLVCSPGAGAPEPSRSATLLLSLEQPAINVAEKITETKVEDRDAQTEFFIEGPSIETK